MKISDLANVNRLNQQWHTVWKHLYLVHGWAAETEMTNEFYQSAVAPLIDALERSEMEIVTELRELGVEVHDDFLGKSFRGWPPLSPDAVIFPGAGPGPARGRPQPEP
jgi:hypothetical protein